MIKRNNHRLRMHRGQVRAPRLSGYEPRVDVLGDDSGITLVAEMPGVAKESLEIKVENDALSIEGAITAATPQALEATYAEVRIPRYRRSFTLSPSSTRAASRRS